MSNAPLAIRPKAPIEPWRDPDWQRLWLSLQARPWRSLAIVPASSGAPVDFTLRIAVTLARTGMLHLGVPIQVADGARVPLTALASFVDEVQRCTRDGDRILIALATPSENPVTTSLVESADAGMLCVLLEQMAHAEAKKTVAQIGVAKFIGSAIFRPDGAPART